MHTRTHTCMHTYIHAQVHIYTNIHTYSHNMYDTCTLMKNTILCMNEGKEVNKRDSRLKLNHRLHVHADLFGHHSCRRRRAPAVNGKDEKRETLKYYGPHKRPIGFAILQGRCDRMQGYGRRVRSRGRYMLCGYIRARPLCA